MVAVVNLGSQAYTIENGDRIAQMMIAPFVVPVIVEGELSNTERGEGGIGSTGVR